MSITAELSRLQQLLPLFKRQQSLPYPLQRLHKRILAVMQSQPRLLGLGDIKGLLAGADPRQAIKVLARADLVVLDDSASYVLGAYPFSLIDTPFQLSLGENQISAMCALDALSVAPMFDCHVEIRSRCAVTETEIFIYQQGRLVLATNTPVGGNRELQIGIRWQAPGPVAAHSLCRDIVFLKDEAAALKWRRAGVDNVSILGLTEAIELAAAFFCPLVGEGQ